MSHKPHKFDPATGFCVYCGVACTDPAAKHPPTCDQSGKLVGISHLTVARRSAELGRKRSRKRS